MANFLFLLFTIGAVVGFHKWYKPHSGPLIGVFLLFFAANFIFSFIVLSIFQGEGLLFAYTTMVFTFWVTATVLLRGLGKGSLSYILINLAQIALFAILFLYILSNFFFHKIGG